MLFSDRNDPGRKERMTPGFILSAVYQGEGVSIMTDLETLLIVIMILTLVFAALSYGRNGK